MASDPIARFQSWFRQAQRAGIPTPEAMAVATASPSGKPSVRLMLLKQADHDGFVFFTNAGSRKGRELRANPRAAAVFYWDPLGKQVRIEGRIVQVSSTEAQEYWETRPRLSRLAGNISRQSEPMRSRAWLTARWNTLRQRYRGAPIPRPAAWTGFRLIPDTIEFWIRRAHRLHHRELFVRSGRAWTSRLLQP